MTRPNPGSSNTELSSSKELQVDISPMGDFGQNPGSSKSSKSSNLKAEEPSPELVELEKSRWPYMDLIAPIRLGDTQSETTSKGDTMTAQAVRIRAATKLTLIAHKLMKWEEALAKLPWVKSGPKSAPAPVQFGDEPAQPAKEAPKESAPVDPKEATKRADDNLNKLTEHKDELKRSVDWLGSHYKSIKGILDKLVKKLNRESGDISEWDAVMLNSILVDVLRVMKHVDEATDVIDRKGGLEETIRKVGQ